MESERKTVEGVTVDGATSCDLDDAIWVKKTEEGWETAITISDVAAHVAKDDQVDKEALERGFTRYLARTNKPMLPRWMADHSLSLLPQKWRDTVTFSVSLNSECDVMRVQIGKSRLKTGQRLSHEDVDKLLDDEQHPHHRWWANCFELAMQLLNKRRKMGALVICDLTRGLVTNEEGQVQRIPDGRFFRAHVIVQELMILANHAVTEHLLARGVEVLFRNHTAREKADVRKHYLEAMQDLLVDPTAEMLEQMTREVRHMLLRARYGPKCQGHFGLNLTSYAHWTSPIRRYADLVNHRILHAHLADESQPVYSHEELEKIAERLNTLRDEEQDGTTEFHRSKVLNRLGTAGEETLVSLKPGDFSRLVKWLVDETLALRRDAQVAVLKRMRAGNVAVADIARVLFNTQATSTLWMALKVAAKKWLDQNSSEVLQVLQLGHELCEMPSPESIVYESENVGKLHAPQWKAKASLTDGEVKYESQCCTATTLREAQQEAAIKLVGKIANVTDEQSDTGRKEIGGGKNMAQVNAKGQLLERCQKMRWAPAEYSTEIGGEPHQPVFRCTATVVAEKKTYRSKECKAVTKKQAEQLASADLLKKVPQNETATESENSAVKDWQANSVGALQEWCQKRGNGTLPVYSFDGAGSSNAPVFACICSMELDADKKEWKGVGPNKKAAKTNAANAACEELLAV